MNKKAFLQLKRTMAFLLAMVLFFSSPLATFAEDVSGGDYSAIEEEITENNSAANEYALDELLTSNNDVSDDSEEDIEEVIEDLENVSYDAYNSNYEYWSQDQSSVSDMIENGCRVVSEAKMLREAGFSDIVNPDSFYNWCKTNKLFATGSMQEINPFGTFALRYVSSKGKTCSITKEGTISRTDSAGINTLMGYLRQDDTYILLSVNGHTTYIGKRRSLEAGIPIVLETGIGVKKEYEFSKSLNSSYTYWIVKIPGTYKVGSGNLPAPSGKKWYSVKATDGLWLNTTSSYSSAHVCEMPYGAIVELINEVSGTTAYKVRYWNQEGYCSSNYLTPCSEPDMSPMGDVNNVVSESPETIRVTGWAFDRDNYENQIYCNILVDGTWAGSLQANTERTDVTNVYKGVGAYHGIDGTINVAPGNHTVEVVALNVGAGSSVTIGTKTVSVAAAAHNPVGSADDVKSSDTETLFIYGWARDDDDPSACLTITVVADGQLLGTTTANRERSDVGVHGYAASFKLSGGTHKIDIWAENVGGGSSTRLFSGDVDIIRPVYNPVGHVDEIVSNEPNTLFIRGWAYDLDDASAAVEITVVSDDVAIAKSYANTLRTDIGLGNYHGMAFTVSLGAGSHKIDIWAENIGSGQSTCIYSNTVTIKEKPEPGFYNVTFDVVDVDYIAGTYTIEGTFVIKNSTPSYSEFPTWTLKDGQDDLVWQNGSLEKIGDDKYKATYTVNINMHNNERGAYVTDFYITDIYGTKCGISRLGVNMDIPNITLSNVNAEISNVDLVNGTYDVETSFHVDTGLPSYVEFASWAAKDDIDDLLFVNADLIDKGNGNYTSKSTVKISDHSNERGLYYTHIYIRDKVGDRVTVKIVNTDMDIPEVTLSDVSAEIKNVDYIAGTYDVETSFHVDSSTPSFIEFASWSAKDGITDLIFDKKDITDLGNGNYKSSATVKISDHLNDRGIFYTHIYLTDIYGKRVTVKIVNVNMDIPKLVVSDVVSEVKNIDQEKGTYDVETSFHLDSGLADHVLFVSWSAINDIDDLVYVESELTDKGNGYYSASTSVSIEEHNGDRGDYYTHIYLIDKVNASITVEIVNTKITPPELAVSDVNTQISNIDYLEGTYDVETTFHLDSSTISFIRFGSWSEVNDIDDLVFNDNAELINKGNGIYSAKTTVKISDHGNDRGYYYTHIYLVDIYGSIITVEIVNLNMDIPSLNISMAEKKIENINLTVGTFDVVFNFHLDSSEIKFIEFSTWTSLDGVDDLTVSKATIQELENGYYSARLTVNTADHNGELGTYNTSIRITDIYGNKKNCGSIEVVMEEMVIEDIKLECTDLSEIEGTFTIEASFTINSGSVDAVKFISYTDVENIPENWEQGLSYKGSLASFEGGLYKASYDIDIASFGNERGIYFTDVYALDAYGQVVKLGTVEVNIPKIIISDIENKTNKNTRLRTYDIESSFVLNVGNVSSVQFYTVNGEVNELPDGADIMASDLAGLVSFQGNRSYKASYTVDGDLISGDDVLYTTFIYLISDDGQMNMLGRVVVDLSYVEKEYPTYDVPTNITATCGTLLSKVTLPKGFSWDEAQETIVLIGKGSAFGNEAKFKAIYTPEDTDKYETVYDIIIPVSVVHKNAEAVKENEVESTCEFEGSYDEVVYCAVEECKVEVSRKKISVRKAQHVDENEDGECDICKQPVFYDGFWVSPIEDKTYTGKAIIPEISVFYKDVELVKNIDYSISISNNINAGKAKIVVKGKGNYSGTETEYFNILPQNIESEEFETDNITVSINSKGVRPTPSLYWNNSKVASSGYTYKYYHSDGEGNIDGESIYSIKEAGYYVIEITGKRNFVGTRIVSVYAGNDVKHISKVSINAIANKKYTGEEITPSLTVKDGKYTLTEGYDYELTYLSNINVGTATVVITGINNYAGTRRVTFKIKAIDISKAYVEGVVSSVKFNGSKIVFDDLSVYLMGKTEDDRTNLIEGEDYKVSYSNNSKVGTASVTFTGINGYTGKLKKSFKITKVKKTADNEDSFEIILSSFVVDYCKGGAKPEVSILYTDDDGNTVELVRGKDYSISYKNNSAVNDGSDEENIPRVIATLKGNYSGTISEDFLIEEKNINDVVLNVSDKVYSGKIGAYKSTPILTDTDGKKLSSKYDYSKVSYFYKNDTTVTEEKTFVDRMAGDPVGVNDIVPANTTIVVIVDAKEGGNYTGSISAEYRVISSSINSATVYISSKTYTGQEITFDESAITVKIKGVPLVAGEDYVIVPGSFRNNINKGTAYITIRGVGNYGGERKVSFKIASKGFKWYWR